MKKKNDNAITVIQLQYVVIYLSCVIKTLFLTLYIKVPSKLKDLSLQLTAFLVSKLFCITACPTGSSSMILPLFYIFFLWSHCDIFSISRLTMISLSDIFSISRLTMISLSDIFSISRLTMISLSDIFSISRLTMIYW